MKERSTIEKTNPDKRQKRARVNSRASMSDAQIRAAAKADPDNPPLPPTILAKLKPAPRVRALRRALSLTQEEFASRFHIPLGTLRDWEQGRSTPDKPTRAYLIVIARDPEHVRKALE